MLYKKLEPAELTRAAEVMAKAFADYPLCDCVRDKFTTREQFLRFMTEIFKVYVAAYRRKGCPVFIGKRGNTIASISILVRPHTPSVKLQDYIKAGALKIFLMTSPANIFRLLKVMDSGHGPCEELMKRSWFIESLAVAPEIQSKHLGTGMIQDCILPYIRKQSRGKNAELTLFTNNEKNRRFYAKNGFEEFDAKEIRQDGCIIGNWSFRMKVSC